MTRSQSILALLAAALFGAWGCSQSPSGVNNTGSSGSKVAKLEADLKAAESARDTARSQIAQVEDKLAKELARALSAEKDRDDARNALKAKSAERDILFSQMESTKKGLKELLGQMEPSTVPSTTTAMGPALSVPVATGS